MPLRRVFKILSVFFLAALALGCGSGGDDNYFIYQTPASGTPARLEFQSVPQRAAGSTFARFSVAIVDKNGNVVTTDSRQVRIRLAEPTNGAILSGTTAVNAVNGVAVFTDLSVDKVGTYTFIAEADGLESAESTVINITPGGAAQISFLQAPPPTPAPGSTPADFNNSNSVAVGQPFANPISVEVRDAEGNLLTTAVTVQLRIVRDGVGGVTVSNNVTTAENGVATFPDFTINNGGGIMVMAAIVNADVVTISEPFMVAAPFSLYAVNASVAGPALTPAQTQDPFLLRVQGVPTATAPTTPIGGPIVDVTTPATEGVYGMATLPGGQVVVVINNPGPSAPQLANLDLTTGTASNLPNPMVSGGNAAATIATDLTVDPSTGTLYTYLYDNVASQGRLHTVDPATGIAAPVGTEVSTLQFVGLAFDVFNATAPVLYGIGNNGADANYVTFDLTSGAATGVVGAVAFPAQTCHALSVVPLNPNTLGGIFQTGPTNFEIRIINKATGETVGTPTVFVPALAATFRFP